MQPGRDLKAQEIRNSVFIPFLHVFENISCVSQFMTLWHGVFGKLWCQLERATGVWAHALQCFKSAISLNPEMCDVSLYCLTLGAPIIVCQATPSKSTIIVVSVSVPDLGRVRYFSPPLVYYCFVNVWSCKFSNEQKAIDGNFTVVLDCFSLILKQRHFVGRRIEAIIQFASDHRQPSIQLD